MKVTSVIFGLCCVLIFFLWPKAFPSNNKVFSQYSCTVTCNNTFGSCCNNEVCTFDGASSSYYCAPNPTLTPGACVQTCGPNNPGVCCNGQSCQSFYDTSSGDFSYFCSGPTWTPTPEAATPTPPAIPPTCTNATPDNANVPSSATSHIVSANGVANATSVLFAVWTTVNGQDDLRWYNGVNQGGGIWTTNINPSIHLGTGQVQVWVYLNPGNVTCDTAHFNKTIPTPTATSDPSQANIFARNLVLRYAFLSGGDCSSGVVVSANSTVPNGTVLEVCYDYGNSGNASTGATQFWMSNYLHQPTQPPYGTLGVNNDLTGPFAAGASASRQYGRLTTSTSTCSDNCRTAVFLDRNNQISESNEVDNFTTSVPYNVSFRPTNFDVDISPEVAGVDVLTNGTKPYTITIRSDDQDGGNDIATQQVAINIDGPNAGAWRGRLRYTVGDWWSDTAKTGSYRPCSPGGGFGSIHEQTTFGPQYLNLSSCSTSVSGNRRTTVFTVTFNTNFTTPLTSNTLSGYVTDWAGLADANGWESSDAFDLFRAPTITPTRTPTPPPGSTPTPTRTPTPTVPPGSTPTSTLTPTPPSCGPGFVTVSGNVYVDNSATQTCSAATGYNQTLATVSLFSVSENRITGSDVIDGSGFYQIDDTSACGQKIAGISGLQSGFTVRKVSLNGVCQDPNSATSHIFDVDADVTPTHDLDWFVSNTAPWWQTSGGDIRTGNIGGLTDPLPINTLPTTSSAGDASGEDTPVFFSSNATPTFGNNSSGNTPFWSVASEFGQTTLSGNQISLYNDDPKTKAGLFSYSFFINRANIKGVVDIPLLGCPESGNCTLGNFSNLRSNNPNGEDVVYHVKGNLTIDGDYTHFTGAHVLILVQGDVRINRRIKVPEGVGNLFIIAARGNITFSKDVGESPNVNCDIASATNDGCTMEGIYTSENDIILENNNNNCTTPDLRFNMAGNIITNSLKPFRVGGTGTFVNNRTLCAQDGSFPVFTIVPRYDFIPQLTDFYKAPSVRWREVNP